MHGSNSSQSDVDLAVVGGGLAGLSVAALVAKAGRSVVLFEQAGAIGGRAATQVREGVFFNLGAHALYFWGQAFALLRELDVPFSGHFPDPGKSLLLTDSDEAPLPRGLVSLARSRLFGVREKGRLIRFLASLARLESRALDGVTLSDWVRTTFGQQNAAKFMLALFRVSTYGDQAERLSAGAAIDQLKLALNGNVWYIDGGWQSLVDGLESRARESGALISSSTRVKSVRAETDGVTVMLSDGAIVRSRTAVLAVPPKTACELLGESSRSPLAQWAASSIPIKAACLDVALDRLARPGHRFALGLDRPYYYSVHSAAAKLAPEGVAVVHLLKYLRQDGGSPAGATEQELERCLDRLQPGWRSHVLTRRFLPSMIVSYSLPLASENGLAGRPDVTSTGQPNIFLAGDWVGQEGQLADASAASAAPRRSERYQSWPRPALN